MARTVSCANNSVHIEYDSCDCEDSDDFEWLLEDFQTDILKAFPALSKCKQWLDREDHAIASSTGLRNKWIESIGAKFQQVTRNSFGQSLIKQGSFSNGEAFFQPVNGKQQGSMGLGFSSKCGCTMKGFKRGFWSRPRSCLMRRPRMVRNGWLHK